MSFGRFSDGPVVSCTVTVKLPVAVFPTLSVAEQFTVAVAIGNVSPEFASQLTATEPSTMSVAEALQVAVAPPGPVASLVMFAGRLSEGGVVSCTVTLKLPFALLPWVSVAEQCTVVTPSGKVSPDDASQITATFPSTMSDAEAENVADAPPGPVASLVMSLGRLRTGGVVSTTATLKLPLA